MSSDLRPMTLSRNHRSHEMRRTLLKMEVARSLLVRLHARCWQRPSLAHRVKHARCIMGAFPIADPRPGMLGPAVGAVGEVGDAD